MQLISKFNKEICFFLYVIDMFSKYTSVIPLKDREGSIITDFFQKILKQSNYKSNKMWVDKGSEFYNRSMKCFLHNNNNNTEMYSMHNEEKSVVAEGFIRALKNKIYKYMTSVSKNEYIDKLNDVVRMGT